MYLTRVELDTRKRMTQVALSEPRLFHGAIERAFEPRLEKKLWRIDKINGNHYLFLLSEIRPNMTSFVRQFCNSPLQVETKEYDKLFTKVDNGSTWRFRLVANPTKSKINYGRQDLIKKDTGRGKRKACLSEESQINWLISRAEKFGFEIPDNACRVVASEWKVFRKNKDEKRPVSMLLVAYEGILTVTDKDKFKETLCYGIGREKAYGAGMLTIGR